ncbi:hypothetical protein TTRE_0000931201 [Trichuris trichiura]|uniref:Uncharacterized protein n=1 Tax=Trichuris trichiura TaxID=36087 RepID=A0A077ZME7_TRITR|nr:hypothetical protein TTRE_0000931201 [Trichuris trichiura]
MEMPQEKPKDEKSASEYDRVETCSLKRTMSEEFLMDCSELELTPEPLTLEQGSSGMAFRYYPKPCEAKTAKSTAPTGIVAPTDGETSKEQLDNDHENLQREPLWNFFMELDDYCPEDIVNSMTFQSEGNSRSSSNVGHSAAERASNASVLEYRDDLPTDRHSARQSGTILHVDPIEPNEDLQDCQLVETNDIANLIPDTLTESSDLRMARWKETFLRERNAALAKTTNGNGCSTVVQK